MSELQTMCRNQGYFDLSQIESTYFEPNGTVSILPVSSQKPAPAADAEVQVPQEKNSGEHHYRWQNSERKSEEYRQG